MKEKAIEEYALGALHSFPFIRRDQLISMMILHFDILSTEAEKILALPSLRKYFKEVR